MRLPPKGEPHLLDIAAQRMDMIDFPGGVLFLAGVNSPNSYAQKSASIVMRSDLDRFPEDVSQAQLFGESA
jgi:phage terminase large subunit GpA-like protein